MVVDARSDRGRTASRVQQDDYQGRIGDYIDGMEDVTALEIFEAVFVRRDQHGNMIGRTIMEDKDSKRIAKCLRGLIGTRSGEAQQSQDKPMEADAPALPAHADGDSRPPQIRRRYVKTQGNDPAFPSGYQHPDSSPDGLAKREYFQRAHYLARRSRRKRSERAKYALDMADAMITASMTSTNYPKSDLPNCDGGTLPQRHPEPPHIKRCVFLA